MLIHFTKNAFLKDDGLFNFIFILKNLNITKNSFIPQTKVDHLENEFKAFFTIPHKSFLNNENFLNKPKFFRNHKFDIPFIMSSFKLYMKINMHSVKFLKVHGSFFNSYLSFTACNTSFINVKKYFLLYKNIFYFMSNIFYYQLPLITFGSSYFKQEVLSIN